MSQASKEYHRAYQRAHRAEYRANCKRYRERHPEKALAHRIKIYGLTLESYAAMLEAQGGKCAICGIAPKRMAVDHDHRTGRVRGLLCGSCNAGLGYFYERRAALLAAIDYLGK